VEDAASKVKLSQRTDAVNICLKTPIAVSASVASVIITVTAMDAAPDSPRYFVTMAEYRLGSFRADNVSFNLVQKIGDVSTTSRQNVHTRAGRIGA
jgi:hypothetical protein